MALAGIPRKTKTPDPGYVIVLCADCKRVTVTCKPKVGNARMWDGLLICDGCAADRLAEMKLGISRRKH